MWYNIFLAWVTLTVFRLFVFIAKQVCLAEKISCGDSSNKCIPASWKCDGEKDCESGIDEAGCTNSKCKNPVRYAC